MIGDRQARELPAPHRSIKLKLKSQAPVTRRGFLMDRRHGLRPGAFFADHRPAEKIKTPPASTSAPRLPVFRRFLLSILYYDFGILQPNKDRTGGGLAGFGKSAIARVLPKNLGTFLTRFSIYGIICPK